MTDPRRARWRLAGALAVLPLVAFGVRAHAAAAGNPKADADRQGDATGRLHAPARTCRRRASRRQRRLRRFLLCHDRMGLGRRHDVGELQRLRPVRGGQEHNSAALFGRAHIPAGRGVPGLLQVEAEDEVGRRAPAPTSPCDQEQAKALAGDAAGVDVDAVMAELHGRVRERLRGQLVEAGSDAFADPALFADVEGVMRAAVSTPEHARLILPELLGEPDTWRLTTKMAYRSHRGSGRGIPDPVRQTAHPDAASALDVRIQPRQFRTPAPDKSRAVCLRAGACARDGTAAARSAPTVGLPPPLHRLTDERRTRNRHGI